jgi:hypothetical protein
VSIKTCSIAQDDTPQDHRHCLTTQHSRGHTSPSRTALAFPGDLDQLGWTTEARMPVGLWNTCDRGVLAGSSGHDDVLSFRSRFAGLVIVVLGLGEALTRGQVAVARLAAVSGYVLRCRAG